MADKEKENTLYSHEVEKKHKLDRLKNFILDVDKKLQCLCKELNWDYSRFIDKVCFKFFTTYHT